MPGHVGEVPGQCCVEVDGCMRARKLWVTQGEARVLGGLCQGEPLDSVLSEEALEVVVRAMAEAGRKGLVAGREITCVTRDGERGLALDVLHLEEGAGGGRYLLTFRDLTPTGSVERELLRSERRYRTLFEVTGAATFTFGEDTVIGLVNSEFERQSGFSREQVVGRMKATDFVDPRDMATIMAYHQARGQDARAAPENYEVRVVDPGGRERIGFFCIKVVPGTSERVVSFVDVTEQRQAQRHVLRAEKLAALGQLVSGVAHEIAKPSSFIELNLPTLRRYLDILLPLARQGAEIEGQSVRLGGIEQDLGELLEDMEHGCELMSDLVEQLRGHVMEDDVGAPAPGDVEPAIRRALALAGPQAKKRVGTIELAVEPDLPQVLQHPGRLQQVLLNLLINAAHACEGCEDPQVRVSARGVDEGVEIAVHDNGCGIPADSLGRIFDPFFTTKEHGTGLGLWISHEIVRGMGGQLEVESQEGVGTVFKARLKASR